MVGSRRCASAADGWPLFSIGGVDGVLDRGVEVLERWIVDDVTQDVADLANVSGHQEPDVLVVEFVGEVGEHA